MYLFSQFDGPINCAKETMSSAMAYSLWRGKAAASQAHYKRHSEVMKDSPKKEGRLLFIKVNCQQKLKIPACHPCDREACCIFLLKGNSCKVFKAVCGPIRCVWPGTSNQDENEME